MSAWDRIAECESNGRWNLPYGHATSTGGLQIQTPTWLDFGGAKYGAHAYMATKQQQIEIAEKVLAGQGPRAWTCNAKTGFPLQSSGPNSSVHKGGQAPYGKPVPPPVKPPVPAGCAPYTVRAGDTLSKIAKAELTSGRWQTIYDLNKATVKNPNLIYPGQHLKMPCTPAPRPVPPAPPSHTTPVSGSYVLPVAGRLGDGLIRRGSCVSRTCGGHSGMDISAPRGTVVRAAAAGTVVSINASGGAYGQHVVVKHAGGIFTLYAHLSAVTARMGQSVPAGGQVGTVGSTGTSTGPHLHFEVRTHPTAFTAGTFLDPVVWLRSHGVKV